MYKKIGISLLALILMFNFTFKDYADAAIATKAATTAAKQIAKEYIQDKAIETVSNYALMEAMDIAEKYQAKEGFKVVCPDGSKNCDKPIQVKESFTETDKQAVKAQAGIELDKVITNGKGMPAWQKFLDWFLPVWLVSFAATAITYAMDGEVRSMFNEAAYNALVALGFIVPMAEPVSIEDDELKQDEITGEYKRAGVPVAKPSTETRTITGTGRTSISVYNVPNTSVRYENVLTIIEFVHSDKTAGSMEMEATVSNSSAREIGFVPNIGIYTGNNRNNVVSQIMQINGQTVATGGASTYIPISAIPAESISILKKKMDSIRLRAPYLLDGFFYTDALYTTVDGDIIKTQAKHKGTNVLGHTNVKWAIDYYDIPSTTVSVKKFNNVNPVKEILVPTYQELEQIGVTPIAEGNYTKDGKVAFIPPAALTYQDETTGETVQRVPNATGDGVVFQKPDGTPVPEENIVANPAPTVTKNPEGIPQYTPAPTPSNPTPTPQPLTPTPTPSTPVDPHPNPNPTQPPAENPPGGGTDVPQEPIPDGPGCEEKFKFPILSPLKETFSTAFPFSIPWDIERAINAAFSGIGHEKPKFNLDLNVLGQKETIEITTPKMFDDWKPFTDTLLVLTFDVLIMFGVYRFVKGAGS